MIQELLYWAGQIGLSLTAVFAIGIVILRGHASGARYFYALWATAGLAAVTLCLPAVATYTLPWPVHLFFLVMGGAFTEGFFVVRKNATYVVDATQTQKANRWGLIGVGGAVVILMLVGVLRHVHAQDEADKRKDDIVQTSQQIVREAQQLTSQKITAETNTTAVTTLKTSLDSTNRLLRAAERRRAEAAAQAKAEREALAKRAKQIEKKVDTLNRQLNDIAPTPPTGSPDRTERVKPVKKGLFHRIFGHTAPAAEQPDSLGAVAHHE